jgi:hypothetical protein
MTAIQGLDRQLGTWLEAQATSAPPEGLLERSLAVVDVTAQRPGWLVDAGWRSPAPDATRARMAAIGAVTFAAIALAWFAVGTTAPSFGVPGSSPSSSPAVSPRSSPSSSPYPCGQGPGSCRGTLGPGSYTTNGFKPALTYGVPTGWANDLDVHAIFVLLDAAGGQARYPDGTTFRDGVYVYRRPIATSATSKTALKGIGTKARDLAQWLSGHADLVASSPVPVAIGGANGYRLEIALSTSPGTKPDRCTADHGATRCASLFLSDAPAAKPGGPDWYDFGIVGPEAAVVYLLDAPSGDTVMVVIDDVDGIGRDALVSAATPIVNSLVFSR